MLHMVLDEKERIWSFLGKNHQYFLSVALASIALLILVAMYPLS